MESKGISRRSLLKGSALVSAGVLLAACAGASPAPQAGEPAAAATEAPAQAEPAAEGEKIKLVVEWPQYTPAKTRWGETAFASYMEAFPHIEIEPMYNTNPDEKLTVAIAGGTPPDVAWHGYGWPKWAVEGVFMPLDELFVQNNVDKSIFWDVAISGLTWDGKLSAMPLGLLSCVVANNLDIYAEAGVEPPAETGDWTFGDLITWGPSMTDPANKKFAATLDQGYSMHWLVAMGGNMGSKNDQWLEMDLNSPERVASMQMYYDLVRKYEIAAPPEVTSEMGMMPYFASNLIGNHWGYIWMVPTFRNDVTDFEWDIAPVPYLEANGKKWRYSSIYTEEMAIISGTQHLQEAWDFTLWFCTTQLEQAALDAATIPAVREIAESDRFLRRDLPPKHIERYLEALDFGVPTMNHPEVNPMLERYNELWPSILSGEVEMPIQAFLDEVNQFAQEVLDAWNAKHS
ncbi:MAG: extracellular solute-binding protein [Anaerolineae bacterium]|nr:extracellular solute-binding protein [Anaerolineae bacterium]